MALKYDFNITLTENMLVDGLILGNNATQGLLIYSIVLLVFGVLLFVYQKKLNDVGLSLMFALFVSTIVSIIIYYMGVFINNTYGTNVVFIHSFVLIAMIILNIVGFALVKFERNSFNINI